MSWPFPARFEEPYFESMEAFFAQADASGYASREDRHIVLQGGGNISWDATSGVLSWDGDLEILAAITGFQWILQAPGQVTMDDGQMFYTDLVRAPTISQTVSPLSANQVPNTDNALLIGVRRGDQVWFRNGGVINDGETISGIGGSVGGGGSGGPENFSYKKVPGVDEDGSGHSGTVTVPQFQQMVVVGGLEICGELQLLGEVILL